MLLHLIWFIIIGLVIGFLGRLVVPGRTPMALWLTLGLGIAGALIGGYITEAIIGFGHGFIQFIVSVLVAALLVWIVATLQARRRRPV